MRASSFRLTAEDGAELFVHRWLPKAQGAARAAVLVSHGMGEHGARYAEVAQRLTAAGYAVYAPDQRGHGRTAPSAGALGQLAERDGWNAMVRDLGSLRRHVARELPGPPHVMLGHSMGASVVQQYLIEDGATLAGAVLSGSAGPLGPARGAALWVARAERLRVGRAGDSGLLRWLLFGRVNGAFEPTRTSFDWLSRDRRQVARYVDDPLCGFVLKPQSLCEMLEAMGRIHAPSSLERIPKELPIYVFSGEEDPMHDRGRRLERLLQAFETAGLRAVSRRVYDRGRHEMFNETNRQQVCEDLIRWLDERVGSGTETA